MTPSNYFAGFRFPRRHVGIPELTIALAAVISTAEVIILFTHAGWILPNGQTDYFGNMFLIAGWTGTIGSAALCLWRASVAWGCVLLISLANWALAFYFLHRLAMANVG